MAELIISMRDKHNGSTLTVMEDGHQWGTKEGPPNFAIIKITGVTADTLRQYLGSTETHKHRFRVMLENITPTQRNRLLSGKITLTLPQLRSVLYDRKLGRKV